MTTVARYSTVLLSQVLVLMCGCATAREDIVTAPQEVDPVIAQPVKPEVDSHVIEETWPDGSRKLRKTVIKAPDGSLLDHGTYTKWHTNGQKEYEATYVGGKLHGVETSWHRNGQRRAEAHYDNHLRHGPLRSWDTQGRLRKEENFFKDKPHGTWTVWNSKGKIKWQAEFEHGAISK